MTQRDLVTAGATGIGLAIATAFAAHGAKIHIANIDRAAVDARPCSSPSSPGEATSTALIATSCTAASPEAGCASTSATFAAPGPGLRRLLLS
jgi:NAD(P)-dependent dehydrogenase (short-subunit alcohol dehydrogenase family)